MAEKGCCKQNEHIFHLVVVYVYFIIALGTQVEILPLGLYFKSVTT